MDGHGAINDTARALFAPLGGDYDRWATILSFAQDPRWRRFLVEHVPVGPEARVLDVATGHGRDRARPGASLRLPGRGRRPVAADARRRARAHRARPAWPTASSCGSAAPRTLDFAEGSFDALTTGYLLRYLDDPLRTLARAAATRASPARRSRCSTSPCRRTSPRAASGTSTPASACRCSAAWSRRAGREVGRYLRPSITAFGDAYPPTPLRDAPRPRRAARTCRRAC